MLTYFPVRIKKVEFFTNLCYSITIGVKSGESDNFITRLKMKDSVRFQKSNLKGSVPDELNPVPVIPESIFEVNTDMSPTVFRDKGYRFFFFSREEYRMHIHVYCANGEAKFWIEPQLVLARAHGVSQKQLSEMRKLIEEHRDDITNAWNQHFKH